MKLYERILEDLKKRQQRIHNGEVNCIPLPFKRFRDTFPGIERGNYYLWTASTKVGKTQVCDFVMMYHPFFYAFMNRDKIKVKIFYFTLEMSKEEKYRQFISHLLYVVSKGKIRIDTKDLRSVNSDKPLSDDILQLLHTPEYIEYFKFFEETVVFIDDERNPTGINKFCRAYALKHGKVHVKTIEFKDAEGKVTDTKDIFDYYEPDDPEEYRIVIVDHLKLLTLEQGMNLKDTIGKFSNDYAVKLRNLFGFIISPIQQQMPSQESNENMKLGKLKPTLDGLSENKSTGQDANYVLGLYAPHRHLIKEYEGYDILFFKDNIRFLEVLAGREGGGGDICPLYFDGAVNFFKELPLPYNSNDLTPFKQIIERIRRGWDTVQSSTLILASKKHKRKYVKNFSFGKIRFWQNNKLRKHSSAEP